MGAPIPAGGFWGWFSQLLESMGPQASQMLGGSGGAAGMASRFAVPGAPGAVNGVPMPQTSMQGAPVQNMPADTGSLRNTSQALNQMNQYQQFQNRSRGTDMVFDSLRTFGTAFGGPQMEGLNNIPRNTPPIIYPQNNQNPGVVSLLELMKQISGGA